MVHIPDEFCDAEYLPHEDAAEMGYLVCLLDAGHPADEHHKAIMHIPCMMCGGIDLHYEWCDDDGTETRYMKIRFTDDGWYWCEEVLSGFPLDG